MPTLLVAVVKIQLLFFDCDKYTFFVQLTEHPSFTSLLSQYSTLGYRYGPYTT